MARPTYTSQAPDWSLIPPHMIGGMRRYIESGIKPGDFLTAVLENDFMEAAGRADHMNLPRLHHYAAFLYNFAPPQCYGSKRAVAEWIKQGGLGLPVTAED